MWLWVDFKYEKNINFLKKKLLKRRNIGSNLTQTLGFSLMER